MSSTTMAILCSGLTISFNGLDAIGSFKALRISALTSATPGFSLPSMVPRRFRAGTRAQTSVFPYRSQTSTMVNAFKHEYEIHKTARNF